jgi:hypothetical protein
MKSLIAVIFLFYLPYQEKQQEPPKPPIVPVISDSEQAKIWKYRLDDARLSNAIQQKWLAIYQTPEFQDIIRLQKSQQQNAQTYYSFASGLCGSPASGYQFEPNSEDIKCSPKPATPEKK